ncbi:hypothetical protein LSH36_433g03011 [Paralvinella palmiformis]|uniref:Uncharacterized protein n=1 Tax=Paralvinella palmiformis TaxID=53620 RepID=A0AAD9JB78_9ANNE|nr:hypothetical protein LSH36_433g03011 [Paralvinella palmiformis]
MVLIYTNHRMAFSTSGLLLIAAVTLLVYAAPAEAKKMPGCIKGPDYCERPLCNPCKCQDLTKLLIVWCLKEDDNEPNCDDVISEATTDHDTIARRGGADFSPQRPPRAHALFLPSVIHERASTPEPCASGRARSEDKLAGGQIWVEIHQRNGTTGVLI